MRIAFWFDFASPYSYVSAMRIEALATQAKLAIDWRPFLLGPIFRDQGWDDSPFNLHPAKGAYLWQDVARQCRRHGLAFHRPIVFPRNSVLAARVACAHASDGWLPDFVREVFRTNFADDRDIAAQDVIEDCLACVGQSGKDIVADVLSASAPPLLRTQTNAARTLGIFGAPTFVVGDGLYWGNDRLEQAIEAATSQA